MSKVQLWIGFTQYSGVSSTELEQVQAGFARLKVGLKK